MRSGVTNRRLFRTENTMSNATTPIGAAFEIQRQSIEQGRRVFEESLEIQQNAVRAFMQNSISVQRSAQQQGADMLRQLFDAQLEAVGSMFEDEEVRSSVDIEFARFEATQDQAWDDFESTFLDAFDDLSDQQQRLFARSVDAYLDAQEDAERTTIDGVRQAEEISETARQGAEDAAETAREGVEEATRAGGNGRGAVAEAADESAEDDEDLELEAIEGLGETYANRLRSAGIESAEQLAQTGSETVADTAEVSESRAGEWISRAQSLS
jgi:predicted flap endonuclease-1-like 5' DNA nuclease